MSHPHTLLHHQSLKDPAEPHPDERTTTQAISSNSFALPTSPRLEGYFVLPIHRPPPGIHHSDQSARTRLSPSASADHLPLHPPSIIISSNQSYSRLTTTPHQDSTTPHLANATPSVPLGVTVALPSSATTTQNPDSVTPAYAAPDTDSARTTTNHQRTATDTQTSSEYSAPTPNITTSSERRKRCTKHARESYPTSRPPQYLPTPPTSHQLWAACNTLAIAPGEDALTTNTKAQMC